MAETDASKAEIQDDRASRGLRRLGGLFALILIPAGIYAAYVLGQIEYIRRHDLRSLENATLAVESLLETTRTNAESLLAQPSYACTFFQRQTLAKLVTPDKCATLEGANPSQSASLKVSTRDGKVEITGPLTWEKDPASELHIEIPLAKFLEQIPFGAAFDQLLIVDDAGQLLGTAIGVQRGSPMLPPRGTVKSTALPMRVLDLGKLKLSGAGKDAPQTVKDLGDATLVQKVELGGTRYTLMCQPWRVNSTNGLKAWRLCGLVDGQRSFRQALEVAPQVVMLLLVLLMLALVSWPVLKILSLAPRERIGFADLYLMLLASLALVMIFAVAAADIGTYAQLRERSRLRLETLATQIERNLTAEFAQMYRQLQRYDEQVANDGDLRNALSAGGARRVSCMLLPPEQRQRVATCQVGLALAVPALYEPLDSVFWARPCDGKQIVKGTVRRTNTPAVPLAARDYFQAIKQDHLWPSGFVVDTSASITTGEFFAALAMPSQLSKSGLRLPSPSSDCFPPEDQRFGAVLTGQPVSVRYPVLAPGVGFAIADQDGRVMFHSDERRAVVAENLLADDGLADRVRAALSARAHADFDAQYQTRPYQVHLQPMAGTPWFVMTFSDNEILRTVHIELLAQTGILLSLYLVLAFIITLFYILFRGRTPPVWVWPRRQPLYRPMYCGTVWTLGAQLIVFLLALDVLRGAMLVLASMLLPLPALATVAMAARAALKLETKSPQAVESRQQWINALLIGFAAIVLVGAFLGMDPVSAAQMRTGTQTWILGVLLLVTAVAATVRKFTAINDPLWMRWWREPLGPHIIGTTIFWLLLGALPAYGLYKFALGMQMTLVAKSEQAYVSRVFAWRDCQIQSDFRQIPTADAGATVERRIDVRKDIYPRALLSRDVEVRPLSIGTRTADERTPGVAFWEYLENVAPVYNETTTWSRYLEPFVDATDERWRWGLERRAEPKLVYSAGKASACNAVAPLIASRLPLREPQFGVFGFLLALGSMSLLIAWVSFGTRKLFFGDIDSQTAPISRGPVGSLLQPPDEIWAQAEYAPIKDCFENDPVKEWSDSGKYATRRAVIDDIRDKVRPYYLSKWQACSAEEKLLLMQLVEEGYANPKQDEVVRKLLQAQLLRLDPVLRPMNQSFALFVAANTEPEQVRKQEQAQRGLRWSLVRTLLVAALLLIMVFLALTQRDVVEVWIAYLGTAGAGTIGVLKLLSLLSKSNAPKSD